MKTVASFLGGLSVVVLFVSVCAGPDARQATGADPGAKKPGDAAKSPTDDQIESLIAAVRKLPTESDFSFSGPYFDMHGNACEEIRSLLKRRFVATDAICKEIERVGPGGNRTYVDVLYYCLGYVKDPASIPWLEKKLKQGDSAVICDGWLRRWRTYLGGAGHSQLKWLAKPDRWAQFFRDCVKNERDATRRLDLLKALAGWFHDPQTIQFFVESEKAPGTEGEVVLVTQVYLHQHKRPIDAARLRAAIEKLKSQRGRSKMLLEYADELRHEAFVPWLIATPPKTTDDDYISAQSVLEKITFRRDVTGPKAWRAWYEKNGPLGKEAWLAQAVAQFEALAEKDPKKAVEFFHFAIYRWNDRALLPHVQRWMKYNFVYSDLIGWINLSYHPFWREDLRPIAEKIIQEGFDRLEPWARDIAKDLDFTKNEETWEDQFNSYFW